MRLTNAEKQLLDNTLKSIGRNINNTRLRRNFSLKKVARLTRLNINTIDHYELGRTTMELPELLKISIALEMPLDKLIADKK